MLVGEEEKSTEDSKATFSWNRHEPVSATSGKLTKRSGHSVDEGDLKAG